RFDLRLGNVLSRQENVLVERHWPAFPFVLSPPAHSPFWAGAREAAPERPKGPERAKTPGSRALRTLPSCDGLPFSLRPERGWRPYSAISVSDKGPQRRQP